MKWLISIVEALIAPLVSFMWGRAQAKKENAEDDIKSAQKANKTRHKVDFDGRYRDRIRRMFDKR